MAQLAPGNGRLADLSILLIEDDAGDVGLLQRAFRNSGFPVELIVARSAAEGLGHLLRRVGEDGPLPDLVLLDLGLPGVDGRKLLSILKSEEALKRIPVIVLSGSDMPDDVEDAYYGGASSFLQKPQQVDELDDMIQALVDFWGRRVRLPQRCAPRRREARRTPVVRIQRAEARCT